MISCSLKKYGISIHQGKEFITILLFIDKENAEDRIHWLWCILLCWKYRASHFLFKYKLLRESSLDRDICKREGSFLIGSLQSRTNSPNGQHVKDFGVTINVHLGEMNVVHNLQNRWRPLFLFAIVKHYYLRECSLDNIFSCFSFVFFHICPHAWCVLKKAVS